MKSSIYRYFLSFIVCLLAIAICYAGYMAYSMVINPFLDDHLHRKAFNSEIWKESLKTNTYNEVRLRMVDDLLKKHNLIGKTREEIEGLLGKPPATTYFKEYDFVYRLGDERGFISIDSEWLVIKFNDNRVIDAHISRD